MRLQCKLKLLCIVRLALRIGVRALDTLENHYPSMRSTNSAMLKQRYYDGGVVQRGVQSVVDTHNSAVENVDNAMMAVRARMTAITCALIAVLDHCENTVERYVANDLPKEDHDCEEALQNCTSKSLFSDARRTAFSRITRLPMRIVYGVDAKVRRRWLQLQTLFYTTLDDAWKIWQRAQQWSMQQANRAVELVIEGLSLRTLHFKLSAFQCPPLHCAHVNNNGNASQ